MNGWLIGVVALAAILHLAICGIIDGLIRRVGGPEDTDLTLEDDREPSFLRMLVVHDPGSWKRGVFSFSLALAGIIDTGVVRH